MTGTVDTPEWTDEDRAALLGLAMFEATLCPGCRHPQQTAWHADMEGWWTTTPVLCHACTASAGTDPDGKPIERVWNHTHIRPEITDLDDLAPLVVGENTAVPAQGGGP